MISLIYDFRQVVAKELAYTTWVKNKNDIDYFNYINCKRFYNEGPCDLIDNWIDTYLIDNTYKNLVWC